VARESGAHPQEDEQHQGFRVAYFFRPFEVAKKSSAKPPEQVDEQSVHVGFFDERWQLSQ
ncbi:MAG: hypothetical protein ACE1ZA_02490, partial [Pseudomonadales bacterium]